MVPYVWDRGDLSKNETILSHCATMANLFPLPMSDDERKVAIAQTLTDPRHHAWECWRKSPPAPLKLVGFLALTRITPRLDALAHFVFFDRQLVGKRPLVQTMLDWCFEQLELRRISVEIPEHLGPLIRFARKLGFKYEGEVEASQHPITEKLSQLSGVNGAAEWIAKWGSRKAGMHYDGESWRSVAVLRLLREERG
jgi:RimJ/RimL family protein N-acetyltransferase